MAVNRKQANMQMLSEADAIQDKTQETIFRIQRQAAETEEVAAMTLDELRKQGSQMVINLGSFFVSFLAPLFVKC